VGRGWRRKEGGEGSLVPPFLKSAFSERGHSAMDTAGEIVAATWSESEGAPSDSGRTLSARDRLRAQLAKRQVTIEQFGEVGHGVAGVPEPPLSKRRLSEEGNEVFMASLDEELIRTLSSGSAAPQDDLVGGTSALPPVDEDGGDGLWDSGGDFGRIGSFSSGPQPGLTAASPNNSDGGDLHAELLECVDI